MPSNVPRTKWNFKDGTKVVLAVIFLSLNVVIFGFWIRHIAHHHAKDAVNYFYLVPFFMAMVYSVLGNIVVIRNPKSKYLPSDTVSLVIIALSWKSAVDSEDFKIISALLGAYVVVVFCADRMIYKLQPLAKPPSQL